MFFWGGRVSALLGPVFVSFLAKLHVPVDSHSERKMGKEKRRASDTLQAKYAAEGPHEL